MADARALLDEAYPEGSLSTADILGQMPAAPSRWMPRAFSAPNRPMPSLDQYVRQHSGGMLPKAYADKSSEGGSLFGEWVRKNLGSASPQSNTVRDIVGKVLSYIPEDAMTAAAFIGPAGAQRLAAARLRHADDWGGINRLTAAREEPGWFSTDPATRAHLWKEFGWTPEHTWGMAAPGINQPATVVATPRFDINASAFRPMQTHAGVIERAEGKLPNLVHGIDELLVAEPSLGSINARMLLDREAPPGGVVTSDPVVSARGDKLLGLQPSDFYIYGADIDELRGLGFHELAHAVATPQNVANSNAMRNFYAAQKQETANPIRGTVAEGVLRRRAQAADLALRRAQETPAMSAAQADKLATLLNRYRRAREAYERAPGLVGYLHGEEERLARENAIRGAASLAQHREMVPGFIDTYQSNGGLPRRTDLGAPLKYFDPYFKP